MKKTSKADGLEKSFSKYFCKSGLKTMPTNRMARQEPAFRYCNKVAADVSSSSAFSRLPAALYR